MQSKAGKVSRKSVALKWCNKIDSLWNKNWTSFSYSSSYY